MSNDATGARRPRRDADTPGAAADRTTRGGPAPGASKTGASVGNAAAAGSSGRGGSAPGSPAPGSPEAGAAAAGATADGNQAGPELARAVLDAAKARRQAAAPRRRTTRGGGEGGERRLRGYSGPGPDPRDPQLLGAVLARIVKARGWQQPTAEATVFGAWGRVVGAEIATHSRPVKLEEGVLTVEAESTAWATQLRLLSAALLQKIAREVGHNVVTRLNIHGPAAPSWSRGPRRVRGRGPRDTYG